MLEMPKMEIQKTFHIENRRYLGSKAKLLDFIHKVVNDNCENIKSFADIFGGTGNVAWSFNDSKTKIIVNDILESNHLSYIAWFGNDDVSNSKIKELVTYYNSVNPSEENYFSKNFSDTYFSKVNCKKIGFIREDIEKKYDEGEINVRERAILITSLIYAMDHIANTVGHYDAYRMHGDLKKDLVLEMLSLPNKNINEGNEIYCEDSNALVKKIKADLVYIDPPYNSRQYCDAYHLLENVATWKKPDVYGVARKMKRSESMKSKYCMQKATLAFDDLIENINAKYILVSYNNMGMKGAGRSQAKINDTDIISALSKKGEVLVFSTDFNQFTAGKTHIDNHQERLFLCKCGEFEATNDNLVNETEGFVKSPLNYTGGKFHLLSQLFDKFDNHLPSFIDLFGGGFNVGVNAIQNNVVYCDKQEEVLRLIKLIYEMPYSLLLDKVQSVIKKYGLSNTTEHGYGYYGCESNSGVGSYNKPHYEALRTEYNSKRTSKEKDILLLTLLFYSFNNQIRYNSKKEFNMPIGKRDFNSSARNNLREFSNKIHSKKVTFISGDFEKANSIIDESAFVYCDPPYYLGIASYNENNGWTKNDEKRLLDYLVSLDRRGVKFALSNFIEHHGQKYTDLLNWIQDNKFNTIYIKSKYSNSNYHIKNKEAKTVEVLITNY
jgi:adenine-specific DNA-methyltransferase